ncbi:MmgE/PrpD family protein [Polymorphospora rubra]|uniref:MmgE/PrpD family protein n=1 Tax=Polymorphospora rubra TaxID=338584 RepID=A0A810N4K2_9ACTN|nr:MmgE/PrpD family protein [Polymorphospora rubra]BCJ68316.1 hypothetical protein Prubr_53370 [Polymorphospora rubra]
MTALDRLSAFVAGLGAGDLSDAARDAASRSLLDTLVNVTAGADFGVTGGTGGAGGPDPGTIPDTGPGADAFRLAVLAQVLDYSDGWRFGGNHPSSPVVAACLAMAVRDPAVTTARIRTAMVAGYEVGARLAAATHPDQTLTGLHPTGTTGAVAAAAAAASLLRLDAARVAAALTIAASYAPLSLIGGVLAGATAKPLDAGYAARTGLEAALLARAGVTGWDGALAGRQGFVGTVTAGRREELPVDDLAHRFTITEVYLKPYPACRHTHAAIEAALAVRARGPFDAGDVVSVDVASYDVATRVVGNRTDTASSYVACQLSLPYVVAAALLDGGYGPAQLSAAAIGRPGVQDLAARVTLRTDGELDARYPAGNPATLTLTRRDGSRASHHVEVAAGDPRRPLSVDQILAKAPPTRAGDAVRAAADALLGADDRVAATAVATVLPAVAPARAGAPVAG